MNKQLVNTAPYWGMANSLMSFQYEKTYSAYQDIEFDGKFIIRDDLAYFSEKVPFCRDTSFKRPYLIKNGENSSPSF